MRTILDGRRDQRVNPPPRASGASVARYQDTYRAPTVAGDQTWVCPEAGLYTIYAWSAGGYGSTSASGGGGGGALAVAQRVRLGAGAEVVISLAVRPNSAKPAPASTVVTIPGRPSTLTCTPGQDVGSGGAGGVASGGDVNVNGAAQVSATIGGDAASYDGFLGGQGGRGDAPNYPAQTPGGGGGGNAANNLPGPGLVIICRDA